MRHVQKMFVFLAVTAFLSGCAAHNVCIKIVDARNNQPISGVSVLWREDSAYNLITERRYQMRPANLVSTQNGVVILGGIHKKWASRLIFSHPEYITVYGIYTPETLELSEDIMAAPVPQDRFILQNPRFTHRTGNKGYIVPMRREQ